MGLNMCFSLLNVNLGVIAFIVTVFHLLLSFLFFIKIIMKGYFRKGNLLMAFLTINLLTHLAWLIYLYILNDIFIRIGFVLEIICSIVFLVLLAWLKIKKSVEDEVHGSEH